ncbi:DNA helicase II / ATP-dependent DNA helicase PcrA [Marmoricola sp. URHA0025 HA25]
MGAAISSGRLLEALDPEQRQVAEALRGPVRVLAGAGTGKTRAITHRIAYGVATGTYNPAEVLAVTFTTRAAGEMRGRLRTLGAPGVQARTFHSAALRQLRWFWPKVYGGEPPQLIESKIPVVAGAARRNRIQVDQGTLRDLASEIEWAKVSNVRPDDYERVAPSRHREVSGLDAASVAHVFGTYEELKREQGRMDMEDVLLIAAALISEDDRVASSVRQQYKWFVVDEYQDVSPIQATLLDLWLGGRDEICVVGDPAQTIYSFAGARAAYLHEFTRTHPGATTVELVRNYRSTPQVIEAANHLLKGRTATAASGAVTLRAQQPAGDPVAWRELPDEVAEAEAVADDIVALQRAGVPLRDMAVLFRINAQSESFEEALAAHAIPYVMRGAARFFERPEVRQALALLRASLRAGEAARDDLVNQVRAVLAGMGWSSEAPASRGQARDRWESLAALVSQAEEYAAADLAPTLEGFVAELDRRAHEQHAPVAEGVTLATLHAAKGLEWDAVFLAGLQDGSMPITYAVTAEAIEEERRLLYVGVTRARKHLTLSWSLARNPGGQARRKPSRFLAGMRPESVTDRPAAPTGAKPGRRAKASICRLCRRPLASAKERNRGYCSDCPLPYDETLFESLKQWRRQRAEAESVPAFVVFSDATLEALAEVRPGDRTALMRINGIGATKLERYADDVLAVLAGQPSGDPPAK